MLQSAKHKRTFQDTCAEAQRQGTRRSVECALHFINCSAFEDAEGKITHLQIMTVQGPGGVMETRKKAHFELVNHALDLILFLA